MQSIMSLIQLTHVVHDWFKQHAPDHRWSEQTLWHRARSVVCHHYGLSPLDWTLSLSQTSHRGHVFMTDDFHWLWSQPHLANAPLGRIIGRGEFCGHRFALNCGTLDPRWETEGLVDMIHQQLESTHDNLAPLCILDVGTGSGCILISLLKTWPKATGWGFDCSEKALEVARLNAEQLGVNNRSYWIHSDGLNPVAPHTSLPLFHAIVSNPPYINPSDNLESDVLAWDPPTALFAPDQGLFFYKKWVPDMWSHLTPSGWLGLEIGCEQGDAVTCIMNQFPWADWGINKDSTGKDRYVWAQKPQTVE